MVESRVPKTKDEFSEFVDEIRNGGDYQDPAAFALGLATIEEGPEGERKVIAVDYVRTNYESNFGTAAVLASALDQTDTGLVSTEVLLELGEIGDAKRIFEGPFGDEPGHGNIETIKAAGRFYSTSGATFDGLERRVRVPNEKFPILGVVTDWSAPPTSTADAYLRLYALSERFKQPNTINLEGIFGHLPNVVFTEDHGAFSPEIWDGEVAEMASWMGLSTAVRSLDKFPRMLDHVTPSGVRIADPSRVRLGAYLAAGTTVMHEGFVNFNAGTLGVSMVEGRISQGVVVGDGTDIGGGVSTLGTLSGGNKERIVIGKNCLLEAECGVGISLGDDCRVEAGLFVKSTTPVKTPKGVVKAAELSGLNNMMFRRNSQTGVVEVVANKGGVWGELNPELHRHN